MNSIQLMAALHQALALSLLMGLAQFTGETKTLGESYPPQRATNPTAEESGGMGETIAQEIRDALEAVLNEIALGNETRSYLWQSKPPNGVLNGR